MQHWSVGTIDIAGMSSPVLCGYLAGHSSTEQEPNVQVCCDGIDDRTAAATEQNLLITINLDYSRFFSTARVLTMGVDEPFADLVAAISVFVGSAAAAALVERHEDVPSPAMIGW